MPPTRKDIFKHIAIILSLTAVILFLFFVVFLPYITKHNERIRVPDLTGKTVSELEAILGRKKLIARIIDSVYVTGIVPGVVIAQNPLPGNMVKSERKIYITLSKKNPPLAVIPSFKDKSLMQVRNELQRLGFNIGEIRYVPGPFKNLVKNIYAGTTLILPGTSVAVDTEISIEVETGEE